MSKSERMAVARAHALLQAWMSGDKEEPVPIGRAASLLRVVLDHNESIPNVIQRDRDAYGYRLDGRAAKHTSAER